MKEKLKITLGQRPFCEEGNFFLEFSSSDHADFKLTCQVSNVESNGEDLALAMSEGDICELFEYLKGIVPKAMLIPKMKAKNEYYD